MPARVDKKERKKLKITWAQPEPESFGESGLKLKFNCEDGLQYETFNKTFFPFIVVGAELDADTELRISTGKDGTEYPHWVMTQIYKDGEAIAKPKSSSGYPRRGSDSESIETQVAFKGIMEAYVAGKLDGNTDIVKAALDWAMAHFNGQPTKPTVAKPASKPAQPTPAPSEDDLSGIVFANAGELKNYLKDIFEMPAINITAATAGFDLATEQGRKDCWASILETREVKPDDNNR